MKPLISTLLLLLWFTSSYSQTSINATGVAFYDYNRNGVPDEGASARLSHVPITAINVLTGAIYITETDDLGKYEFNLEPSYYKLVFEGDFNYLDFKWTGNINLDANIAGDYQNHFAFQPQPTKPVFVTGRVYYDNNNNKLFDAGDSVLKRVEIRAQDNFGTDSTVSNSGGLFFFKRDLGSNKFFLFNDSAYIQADYKPASIISKIYYYSDYDTLNIPVPKKNSIDSVFAGFITPQISISHASITKHYQIKFGFDGLASNTGATLSLNISPRIQYRSANLSPSKIDAGYIEWRFSALPRGYDTIELDMDIPATGDTISSFTFLPKLTLDSVIPVTAYVRNAPYFQSLDPFVTATESTKGIKWLRTSPGDSLQSRYATTIDTTDDNDIYIAGYESGNLKGGYVAKLSPAGLTKWEQHFECIAGWRPVLKHTNDGGCVVLSTNLTSSHTSYCIIVRKFDRDGNKKWEKQLDGAGNEGMHTFVLQSSPFDVGKVYGLVVLADGSLMIAGNTNSSDGDFAHSNSDTLHNNAFIIKLSANGERLWSKVYGGKFEDGAYDIIPLSNGSFMVLGTTQSVDGDIYGAHKHGYKGMQTVMVENGFVSDSSFYHEAWVMNIDGNGNMKWNRCYGGTRVSNIYAVHEMQDGLLLAGLSNSSDGDLANSTTNTILWLLKVNFSGEIVWSKPIARYPGYKQSAVEGGGAGIAYYTRFSPTSDGNLIIGAIWADTYGFLHAEHGYNDLIVVKIDLNGNVIWQKAIGGSGDDQALDLMVDKHGDVLVCGSTNSGDQDIYESAGSATQMIVCKLGTTNMISGKVFIDRNANHIQDTGEPLFNEGRIYSYKTDDTTIARIFNGKFLNNVDTGNYITSYAGSNYYTAYPAQQASVFSSLDQEDTIDFALIPTPGINDLQTAIVATTPSRPGFNAALRIVTKNVGTTDIANTMIKLSKPASVSYLNSKRTTTTVAADTVTFSAISLAAGAIDTLDVNIRLATPPTINNGDTLAFTAIALPQAADTTPTNNQTTLFEVVRGSFDPNDKTEAHAGVYTPTMQSNGEPFQYLIRFQNTGTDTAFYVTIKDTLDSRVNINTLETISSSHPYTFSMEGNIATWQFNMLKLVDSTTNEMKSHGYISFSIEPKDDLKIGDSVLNKAAIYFDYNLPVITNNALVTMISAGCPKGNSWTGLVSTAWENPSNWSCGTVPTETTDVLIKAGTPYQPVINVNSKVNSITAGSGAKLMVKSGVLLELKGKSSK